MIKLTGCIILIISCSTIGFIKADSYRQRRRELEDVLEILKILNLEITYKKEPLAKAFRKCSIFKNCWFSEILKSCAGKLEQHENIMAAWNSSIDDAENTSPLCSKDTDILKDFVLGLGKSDAEGQEKIFEPLLKRIEMNIEEAKDAERVQGKMYKSLGVSAGIVIAVILI